MPKSIGGITAACTRRRSLVVRSRGTIPICAFVFGIVLMFPGVTQTQGLNVPIIVQPAEWTGMAVSPSGTRTNAPVTFGIGIPDSAGIDCPGKQDLPQHEQAPTKLALQSSSGARLHSQFRCMAHWPSGNAKWVLVDAQLSSYTEGLLGYDATLHVVQLASGGGNFPARKIADECSGAGHPVAACPDANHIVVSTGAATFLIKRKNYNLFDDVQVGSAHVVSASNHGANDGLILTGPPDSVIPPTLAAPTIDSVSCNPGPIPTNYSGTTTCSTVYSSNQDPASTCVIEEDGPLRAVVMCQGDMDNSEGHPYMHWRTRMHFWANRTDAKVTVAMRNADVPAGDCCNTAHMTATDQFKIAYKEFNQFEARLTDNLGSPSSRNASIANHKGAATKIAITAANRTDSTYIYQAYSKNGEWPHWDDAVNCRSENDRCVVSPIPRSGQPAHWDYATTGYQIQKNGSVVESGDSTQYPVGWADLDDGTNGIEVGVYQFSMYWPKSLEFQPGAPNHNEIRIGILPNQDEYTGVNERYASNGADSGAKVAYVMGWPQYSIRDLYFNFHAGVQSAVVAQNNFLYFQHYLLARPASGTYYNTVKDQASGVDALFYDIPDPIAEDDFYKGLHRPVCTQPAGQCLGDVGQINYPYTNRYAGMKVFRIFGWPTPGGSDGTQFEQRESFLRNWLQRGGTTTLGSQPGRYIFAGHFYRMVAESTLPRSDTATSGPGAGFRSLCTSQSVCDNLGFYPWGDPKNHVLPSVWNGGMRNWGDDPNSMAHSVYWGAFDYYFLSGDEWIKEQLLQGFKDRYQNPFVAFNNLYANAAGNRAPGHEHIPAERAMGHWFSGAARLVQFLRSIGDPDADTPTTVLTSPGTSPSTATALQGIEQNIAAVIGVPYISSGYPAGWVEPSSSANCLTYTGLTSLCSTGQNPTRGWVRTATGGGNCGNKGVAPCDGIPHRLLSTLFLAIWAEGTYDMSLVMRDLLGPNWHLVVKNVKDGDDSNGNRINPGHDGAFDVVISDRRMQDALYGAYLQLAEENCVTVGFPTDYRHSGCVYTQFSDYLNSGPPCWSSGNCLRDCSTGCAGLTQWFAFAGAAPTTNSTFDLSGKSWQFLFESQLQRAGGVRQELGSHMMQFALNYILAAGSTNANGYAISPSAPVLRFVAPKVTACSGTGCSFTPTSCVGPLSGTGTCTITWRPPSGLTAVNGTAYRLKYLPCQSGTLTIFGNDCPVNGKRILPALLFHSDATTCPGDNVAASDGSGCWEHDPASNWNWAFTIDVPDCSPGQTPPDCNANVLSGDTYTFNTRAKTTYTFSLSAYSADRR